MGMACARNENIIIQNIIVHGCQGGAAVVDSLQRKERVSASFIGVNFIDNGGHGLGKGGALRISGASNVYLRDCKFKGNRAQKGGAIFGDNSSVTVEASAFNRNVAALGGGAIYMQGPTILRGIGINKGLISSASLNVKFSVFNENIVTESVEDLTGLRNLLGGPMERMQFLSLRHPSTTGGSIFATGLSFVSVENSRFNKNKARGGGAISLGDNIQNILKDTQFYGNRAIGTHGKETASKQELLQQPFSSELGKDMQGIHGGAVYAASTITYTLLISNCSIVDSHAAYGGGLHVVGPQYTNLLVEKSWFDGNMASVAGGGILVRNTMDFRIRDTVITNNAGKSGGGLLVTNGAEMLATNSQFIENWAIDGGGLMGIGAGTVAAANVLHWLLVCCTLPAINLAHTVIVLLPRCACD